MSTTVTSDYSRHISRRKFPQIFEIAPHPEIWQCEKFSQLILMRIIEIAATRCQILRLKCTKFDFGWGFASDPLGDLTALP